MNEDVWKLTLRILPVLCALAGVAGADEAPKVEAFGRAKLAQADVATEMRFLPLSPAMGTGGYQRSAALPPFPPAAVDELKRLEGANAAQAKGRLQIGIARSLDQPVVVNRDTVQAGDWMVLASGWRVYTVEVVSPGALGLRVHLESLALPGGARLLVYDPANPARSAWSVTAEGLSKERKIWSQATFAENAVIECQVPPGTDTAGVAFTVAEVSHLFQLPALKALKASTECENDASCFPAWADPAKGIALIDFFDSGIEYLCTGCLLNANSTNGADYFLTANHCITDQTIASTMTLYWFYQTSACNGSAPDLASVPQTGPGADLLATDAESNGNDFSFLRLHQSPPAGAYYFGWSIAAPTSGETLTVLHHPQQDPTRISFGTQVGVDADFWHVRWTSGITEKGSSGAPLCNANRQVVGQLYGGSSSCDNPAGIDVFGRFDLTYDAIKRWINGATILTVVTNGPGTVSPDYNGQSLQIGHRYKMTAKPSGGSVFAGWSGSLATNALALTFTMQSNMVLQANFVTNPFTPIKGTYTGLFGETNGAAPASSGAFTLAITQKGTYSGSLRIGAARYSISGPLDVGGNAQATVTRAGTILKVLLHVDVTNRTGQVTGTVSGGDWTAELYGNRAAFDGRKSIALQNGQYTMIIPGDSDPAARPGGDSYATVSVDKSGKVRLSGSLGDGTRMTQSATLSAQGQWPLYLPLYRGHGLLWGWMSLTNASVGDLSGELAWIKPAATTTTCYPGGFTNETMMAWGLAYAHPPRGGTPLGNTNAVLLLSGGGLNTTNPVTLGTTKATSRDGAKLRVTFNLSSGLFSGWVNSTNAKPIVFNGVVLQASNFASGFFLTGIQSGRVSIVPQN